MENFFIEFSILDTDPSLMWVVYDLCGYWNWYVNLLSSCTHSGGFHIQRFSAHGADRYRIPSLGSGDVVGLEPCAPRMSLLSACLSSGRFALGLRVSFIRSDSRLLRSPVLKSFSIPQK
ncbi:MAG: hypothetical protein MJY80_07640 [Bacteroidales bacterium]|nr:hypothetical protein [Bacteroidales bacterium]